MKKNPLWFQYILDDISLDNKVEFNFELLSILNDYMNLENQYPKISNYFTNLLSEENNYSDQGLCFKIFRIILSFLEIKEYRDLSVDYYLIFIKHKMNMVIKMMNQILCEKSMISFYQVSLVWKLTSQFNNSDCIIVLQDTVYNMLNYIFDKSPVIQNYLINWFNESIYNFKLILDNILKNICSLTNWNLKNNKIHYNIAFDCESMSENLTFLMFIFNSVNKVNYSVLSKIDVKNDFDMFIDRMDVILDGKFNLKKKNRNYFYFITRLLLKFYLGVLNPEESFDKLHSLRIFEIKIQILKFYKKIIKNLEDFNLISIFTSKIIPSILIKTQEFLKPKSVSCAFHSLDFIQFLIVHTKMNSNEKTVKEFNRIFTSKNYLEILIQG